MDINKLTLKSQEALSRAQQIAAERNHQLGKADAARARKDWAEYWSSVRPVELTPAVERHAGELARLHRLRGADAVHLASALAVGADEPQRLLVAVWDARLASAAGAAGLAVAPAGA